MASKTFTAAMMEVSFFAIGLKSHLETIIGYKTAAQEWLLILPPQTEKTIAMSGSEHRANLTSCHVV